LIYLDTSVVLAALFSEDRQPDEQIWSETLVSSRLLEYEVWTRVNALNLGESHGEAVRDLLARVAFVEMVPPVLARVLEPFPEPVRTLDALHLASLLFLREQAQSVRLLSYDSRMLSCAKALGISLFEA
jgi:predicted nucleic acid-binding protein